MTEERANQEGISGASVRPKKTFHDVPLLVTVSKVKEECYRGYKEGDTFLFEDFTKTPPGFCQGAATVLFPCLYGLTFGAEFRFEDNPRSIHTTCPDGGKVEFFTQVLDKLGNVVKAEKKEIQGPSPKKMIIGVEEVNGHCAYGYKQGDTIEITGLKTPEGFCGGAYNALFPVIFALNMGAKFPFSEDENANLRVTCPDNGIIRFKVRRVE
jgi:uncharacterized repeat protein (TIGR04076 family)